MLAEDWHLTYWSWTPGMRPAAGGRTPPTYSARCTDPECLGSVIIERRAGGWWWTHGDLGWWELGEPHTEGGPFVHWQEAAAAAVAEGIARPQE